MKKEILIYALPSGQNDSYMEDLISTQCTTQEQIDRVKTQASVDGYHSFRITYFDPEIAPNFGITKLVS